MVRALVVLALLAGSARADVLSVGEPVAELDVAVDAAGNPFKLAAYRGRWIVITTGAAWCEPCKAELPVWDKLAGEFAGRVAFVALDIDDDVADGKAFHTRLGLGRMVRAYLPQSTIADRYGAQKMPTTFVIDPGGVVRHVQAGFEKTAADREAAKLRDALGRLVPKPRPKEPPKELPKPPAPPVVSPIPKLILPEPPHAIWWGGWSLAL